MSGNGAKWCSSLSIRLSTNFIRCPQPERNSLTILKLIHHYWSGIQIELFENKAHYYSILAGITDHLLTTLINGEKKDPPLFLYEKLNTFVEEMNIDISITFELAEWGKEAFSVKKFLVDADESMVKLYTYLTILFSYKAFGVLPDRIDLYTLIDGEKHIFYPTDEDIPQAIMYLDFLKEHIKKPDHYFKTESLRECSECIFENSCGFKKESGEPGKTMKSFVH
jgi:hypothetical protein